MFLANHHVVLPVVSMHATLPSGIFLLPKKMIAISVPRNKHVSIAAVSPNMPFCKTRCSSNQAGRFQD